MENRHMANRHMTMPNWYMAKGCIPNFWTFFAKTLERHNLKRPFL